MNRELAKTLTYLSIHLVVGFSVAYAMTGSIEIAGGIALIEPCINAIAFFFHERALRRLDAHAAVKTESPPAAEAILTGVRA